MPNRLPPARAGELLEAPAIAIPLRIETELGLLSFLSTITVFGTPVAVTLSEIALEMLYPADTATSERIRARGTK